MKKSWWTVKGEVTRIGPDMIYFDNAATTMHKPPQVITAVTEAMQQMGNAGRGVHSASLGTSRTIFDTRVKLAQFFHASDPRRIAFTCNSTESLNLAIKGAFLPGDHVITTELEHNSVLRPLYEMEEKGVSLSFVSSDKWGRIRISDFEKEIRGETRAIVCTHASNLTGNVVDIEAVGEIAKKHGLLFIVDASQSAGVSPIDVDKMHIDILCFTGHKGMYGPQGTGGIYVREGISLRPLKSGGSGVQTYSHTHPKEMPTALEAGTLNGHGIAGLHAALEFLEQTGLEEIRKKEQELMMRFYQGVMQIPGVFVYGDFSTKERCAVVALNLEDYDSSDIADELSERYGICVRPGAHCAPLMHQALGTVEQGAVRFSFSYFNTEEEIDRGIEALRKIAEE